ncbi:MAG: hypothetical protein KAT16_07725 [Candidatus Heimdallarchaeota archaeon]|nr:hypothetical protein [Candidatus Heimdallarchaeota archaeon]
MLRQMKLPKKLRTVHHPGNKVEIWMDNRKITKIQTLTDSEQNFMRQFINNLKDLGWKVLAEEDE